MGILRTVVVALTASWCVLGLVYTAEGLAGPIGFSVERDEGTERTLGLPLPWAKQVTTIDKLLSESGSDAHGAVLVLAPPRMDPLPLAYVGQQLAHLQYPRHIDVVALSPEVQPEEYATVITAPGIRLAEPWAVLRRQGGHTLWVRPTS